MRLPQSILKKEQNAGGPAMHAVLKVVPIKLFVEECVVCVVQLLDYALGKVVPIEPFVEECALGMVESDYVVGKDAPIVLSKEECA